MTVPPAEPKAGDFRLWCTECRALYRARFDLCPRDGAELEPLTHDPLLGQVLHDRYLIEGCIGEGAMGRVYRARHTRMSKRFAIKVLFGDLAADARMRARFAQEAEAASRLDHPNVVTVVDFAGVEQGLMYLVMDFIEGENLADLLAAQAPFDRDRVIRLARDLARGLGHAHQRGLVHRDFKPENVVVVREGAREVPKIIDFGVACIEEREDPRLTQVGCVVGTPAYMSPEQAAGLDVDHRTDLFSLGLLLYELLSGVAPFEGSPIEIARLNATASIPPIAQRARVQVDPRLEEIVRKLLAKNLEERFQNADQVIEALDRLRPDSNRAPIAPLARGTTPFTPPEVPRLLQVRRIAQTSEGMEEIALPAQKRWGPTYLFLAVVAVSATVFFLAKADIASRSAQETIAAPIPTPPVEPVAETPVEKPKKKRIQSERTQPKEEIATAPDPSPPKPAEKPRQPLRENELPDLSIDLLTNRYLAVGNAVDAFAMHGGAAAKPFVERYKEMDPMYRDALRLAPLRREVVRELDVLAADVKRAEQALKK